MKKPSWKGVEILSLNKKIAFGDNSKVRFSVVRKVFYTFLYHKKKISSGCLEKILCACIKQDIQTCRYLLKEGVNLEALTGIACQKGVLSIVYQRLKSCRENDALTNNAFRQMQMIYLANCAKNYYYKKELLKILNSFWENNIPVIPLKGIALSQRLYADIVSRDQSADIDLLVQEKDKEVARMLLETLGCTFLPVDEIRAYQWYYLFSKPALKPIELHWDITMMARVPQRIEGFWQGLQVRDWEGVKFYDFMPEELLLYLAAHLVSSDSFLQLRYICDINALLNKYGDEINWDALVGKAKKWRVSGAVYAALALSQDFFGLNFPQVIFKQLSISLPKRWFIRAFANKKIFFRHGLKRQLLDAYLSYVFFALTAAVSCREYLIIFQRVFFPLKETTGGRNRIFRITKGLFGFTQGKARKKQSKKVVFNF